MPCIILCLQRALTSTFGHAFDAYTDFYTNSVLYINEKQSSQKLLFVLNLERSQPVHVETGNKRLHVLKEIQLPENCHKNFKSRSCSERVLHCHPSLYWIRKSELLMFSIFLFPVCVKCCSSRKRSNC